MALPRSRDFFRKLSLLTTYRKFLNHCMVEPLLFAPIIE